MAERFKRSLYAGIVLVLTSGPVRLVAQAPRTNGERSSPVNSAKQLKPDTNGSTIFPQTRAEVIAAVIPVDLHYPEGDIKRYGNNIVPGETVMTAAFQALAAVMTAKGGGAAVLHSETYLVWSDTSPNLMYLKGVTGLTIEGNGAVIQSGRENGPGTFAITLDATRNTVIRHLTMIGSNTALARSSGEGVINLINGATNTTIEDVKARDANVLIECGSSSQIPPTRDRVSGIVLINVVAERTYYGLACTGNGDNVRGNIRGIDTTRVYFPWNVRNHDIWIDGEQGGAFTDVLMKCYAYKAGLSELRGIRVHYQTDGKSPTARPNPASDALIKLELQVHDDGAHCEIRDIDVAFDVNVASGNGGRQTNRIFDITKYDENGVQDHVGRGHTIDNVHIHGIVRNFQNSGAYNTSLVPLMIFDNSTDGHGSNQFDWTGDFATNIDVGPVVIRGGGSNRTFPGLLINGQAAVRGKLFVDVHDVDLSSLSYLRANWSEETKYRETRISAKNYSPMIFYAPSWTALTVQPQLGNGALTGRYQKKGNQVEVKIDLVAGNSTTSHFGVWYLSLPSTPRSTEEFSGECMFSQPSETHYACSVETAVGGAPLVKVQVYTGADDQMAPGPFPWATGATLNVMIRYVER